MDGFKRSLAATLLVALVAPAALAQENGGFEVELTADSIGAVDSKTGLAMITGMVTCSGPAAFSNGSIELIQPIGRKGSAHGFAGFEIECEGVPTPFARTVFAADGRFGPGTALAIVTATGCDLDFVVCDTDQVTMTVRLRAERLDLGS